MRPESVVKIINHIEQDVLFLTLCVLKLTHAVDWSWWKVIFVYFGVVFIRDFFSWLQQRFEE